MPRANRPVIPVEEMLPAERDRAVATVRSLLDLVALITAQAHARAKAILTLEIEGGKGPGLDSRGLPLVPRVDMQQSVALLNYTKTANEILAAHPGLEKLLGNDGMEDSESIGGDDAAERVRRALGVGGPP